MEQLPIVAVGICTYRRPEILGRLLGEIAERADEVADIVRVGVVVVDDDPDRSAETVVQPWIDRFAAGLTYTSTGSGNIAVARNESLRHGTSIGTSVALIDDDCRPAPGWLRELLRVQRDHDADIVSGHCIDLVGNDAPPWVAALREPRSSVAEGAPVEMGYTKNVLLSSAAIERHGWDFDVGFGRTGGEDAVFFYRAADDGANHRHAPRAIVYEPVPAERLTFAYQCRRRYWYGTTEALTTIATGRATRRRAALRAGRHLAAGLWGTIRAGLSGRRDDAGVGVVAIMRGAGMLAGSVGARMNHR